jgi:hypothetical protein
MIYLLVLKPWTPCFYDEPSWETGNVWFDFLVNRYRALTDSFKLDAVFIYRVKFNGNARTS